MDNKLGSIDNSFDILYTIGISYYSFGHPCLDNTMNMNKAALAQAIADRVGNTKKESEDMVNALVHIIMEQLQLAETVNIAGFGQFSAKTRAGRVGVNPQNPTEKIQIPPVTVPKFKAGKALKDCLKKKKPVAPATPTAAPETPAEPPHSTFGM